MVLCGGRWSGFAPTDMPRIAIVAALEREVAPLIRRWQLRTIEHSGRRYRLFENGEAGVICGGMGAEAARRATEAIIQQLRPSYILSVGFVGALDSTLKVGEVFEPRIVINAADGARTDTGSGRGTLVSFDAVAGVAQKEKLRDSYAAAAVDMEAAAVAQGAGLRNVHFGALKAVSDDAGFVMPPLEDFVKADGSFCSTYFAVHVATRPWLWGKTIVLARNSARASRALCSALEQLLERAAAGTLEVR
jgi:adenosylhomocysteine nucleosidase